MKSIELQQLLNRRQLFQASRMGLGTAALGALVASECSCIARKAQSEACDFFSSWQGAPSQVDLFDYKPDLDKQFQKPLPQSISKGQRVTAMTRGKEQRVVPTMFKFNQSGESGIWVSELLPHLAKQADRLCMIKSFHTNAINHDRRKRFFAQARSYRGKQAWGLG